MRPFDSSASYQIPQYIMIRRKQKAMQCKTAKVLTSLKSTRTYRLRLFVHYKEKIFNYLRMRTRWMCSVNRKRDEEYSQNKERTQVTSQGFGLRNCIVKYHSESFTWEGRIFSCPEHARTKQLGLISSIMLCLVLYFEWLLNAMQQHELLQEIAHNYILIAQILCFPSRKAISGCCLIRSRTSLPYYIFLWKLENIIKWLSRIGLFNMSSNACRSVNSK